MTSSTAKVLAETHWERRAQDARWGERNHPDRPSLVHLGSAAREATYWKSENAYRARTCRLAWDGILLEEVYEALAEADVSRLRAELIQVAAVAVAWVEALDRRE